MTAVCSQIGCLQLDPVPTVARSPLLVLFARLGPVSDGALDRAAYRSRTLFDAWAHEASLVAVSDLPLHRWAIRRAIDWPSPRAVRAREFLAANREFAEGLVEEIRATGPVRARDLEDRSSEPWRHGWWTKEVSSRQTIARMLQLLWTHGRLGVSRRDAGERIWDVFDRCLPPGTVIEDLSDEEAERQAVLRALGMLGVARPAHIRKHFLRRIYARLPSTLEELSAAGLVERCAVQGLGDDWWALTASLDGVDSLRPGTKTTVLSPFDNLLCDRDRAKELFGFDHRLEIYVPASKRVWGYYVLPILRGEQLVARADAAVDREAGVLRIHTLHREEGIRRSAALDRAVTRSLEALAAWRDVPAVEITAER